jgi:hypothetical protein
LFDCKPAPRNWFNFLYEGLQARGFTQKMIVSFSLHTTRARLGRICFRSTKGTEEKCSKDQVFAARAWYVTTLTWLVLSLATVEVRGNQAPSELMFGLMMHQER